MLWSYAGSWSEAEARRGEASGPGWDWNGSTDCAGPGNRRSLRVAALPKIHPWELPGNTY